MIKTTLYLEEETALALERVAKSQGRSQEDVLRDALAFYSDRPEAGERPLPKGLGKYSSGRSDVSENAEQLLRAAARARR